MIDAIPANWTERLPLWVLASFKLGSPSDAFLSLEIQQLGQAERMLLDLEHRAFDAALEQQKTNQFGSDPFAVSEAVAHSRLWLLGLYETLRTFGNLVGTGSARFAPLNDLYWQVNIARIPLAKHQAKGLKNSMHYPNTIIRFDTGWIGWNVFDKRVDGLVPVYRTELANKFLTAMTGT